VEVLVEGRGGESGVGSWGRRRGERAKGLGGASAKENHVRRWRQGSMGREDQKIEEAGEAWEKHGRKGVGRRKNLSAPEGIRDPTGEASLDPRKSRRYDGRLGKNR